MRAIVCFVIAACCLIAAEARACGTLRFSEASVVCTVPVVAQSSHAVVSTSSDCCRGYLLPRRPIRLERRADRQIRRDMRRTQRVTRRARALACGCSSAASMTHASYSYSYTTATAVPVSIVEYGGGCCDAAPEAVAEGPPAPAVPE
jgi:hypothetical protein